MTELKTLKDIEYNTSPTDGYGGIANSRNMVNSSSLKDEAVKRINFYKKRIASGISHNFEKTKPHWEGAITELMDFFNLTEEELEEKE